MLFSLLPQLSSIDELIIVDDCSTDNSLETISDLQAENVRIIRMQTNSGPASARNAGVAEANGTHILFFDADDIPHPSMLSTLRIAIQKHQLEDIFSFKIAYAARGESQLNGHEDATICDAIKVLPVNSFASSALHGKPLCTASSTCVSKVAFNAVSGFSEKLRYCEDPELWVRMSARYKIVYINRALAVYRDVSGSLSYALREVPGSVHAYVQTLLQLDAGMCGVYKQLAKSVIRKNIIFSLAVGGARDNVNTYMILVAPLFDRIELFFLKNLLLHAPKGVIQLILKARVLVRKRFLLTSYE